MSELRDAINNYTTTTGITATLSTDKSSIIMVQNEGYDIKLGDVNFNGDSATTGARRTLIVTSLDNDELVAGDAVSLGDTNVTTTSTTSVVAAASGTGGSAMTLNSSGIAGVGVDDNGLVTAHDIAASGSYTLNGALKDSTSLNSKITIQNTAGADNTSLKYTITGTDQFGNTLTEEIDGVSGNGAIATGSKVFKTVTAISVNGDSGAVQIGTTPAVAGQAALITISSLASDESGKKFTIVGTILRV